MEGGRGDRRLLTLLQEALDGLGPDGGALRARMLARFSIERTFSEEPALREARRDALSREGLAMARRLGDVSPALRQATTIRDEGSWPRTTPCTT